MADEKKSDESNEDVVGDLGGIFGVSSKKKKKKKDADDAEAKAEETDEAQASDDEDAPEEEEEAPAEEADDSEDDAEEERASTDDDAESEEEEEEDADTEDNAEEEQASDEDEEEPEPVAAAEEKTTSKKKKQKSSSDSVAGVFSTGGGSTSSSHSEPDPISSDPYLDEDDLGDVVPSSGTNKGLIGVIVVLAVALVGVVLGTTDIGGDILLVLKGEYRAQKDAEKKRKEEEFAAAQEAALPKYGNLMITGTPKYAAIKLNGEKQYGKTSSGTLREVQLIPGSSNFANLPVKEKHIVEVSAPNYETKEFELTEGKWQGQNGAYSFNLTASLLPQSEFARNEFDARMSSDIENEFFGTMRINAQPEGAVVKLNNKEVLNEEGEPMEMPATFEKYWTKDEESDKLEENKVKVDTVFDNGHKLEIVYPDNEDLPGWVTQVERQMWTCNRKPEDEIKKLPEDHSLQEECEYTYSVNLDFNALKAYVERREEERERVKKQREKVKELRAKMMKGEEIDPATLKAIQDSSE